MLGCVAPGRNSAPAGADLAIVHGTVVDVQKGRLLTDQTILIDDNRIQAVGSSANLRVPSGARVVDATGKYVIPGLWDMHVHLNLTPFSAEIDLPLLVANGVTGVREMVSDCPAWSWLRKVTGVDCLERLRTWQREIAAGDRIGPRILALGSWIVSGRRSLPESAPAFFAAETAAQGRELARHDAAQGVDFVKIHDGISREGFFALVEEARRLGLDAYGHPPLAISAIDASEAGQRSFEHANVFLFNCFPGADEFRRASAELDANTSTQWRRRMVDDYDPSICQGVFRVLAANGTGYVPTHVTRRFDASVEDSNYRNDPRSKYVPRAQWENWNDDADGTIEADASSAGRKTRMDYYKKGLEITGAAHKAGVNVMLGTDSGDSYVFPGFAVHDELLELVKAGLTPAQALRSATWNSASFLGLTDEFGSVRAGNMADIVLLDADPLADIANTRRISAVVLNGRYLDRAALDQLLSEAERAAKGDGGN
jgi:hypothetical protein